MAAQRASIYKRILRGGLQSARRRGRLRAEGRRRYRALGERAAADRTYSRDVKIPRDRTMAHVDFLLAALHNRTKRDYVGRVVQYDKANCSRSPRSTARTTGTASASTATAATGTTAAGCRSRGHGQALRPEARDRILDVGCGKGFLLHEVHPAVPGVHVEGIDISEYAIANAKEEVKPFLKVGNAPRCRTPTSRSISSSRWNPAQLSDQPALRCRARDRAGGQGDQEVHHGRILAQRTRAHESAVLAAHLRILPRRQNWEWIYKQSGYQGDWGFIFFE